MADPEAVWPAVLGAGVDLQTEPLQIAGFQIGKNKTTFSYTDRSLEKLLNSPYPVHQESDLKGTQIFYFVLFYFLF